MRATASKVGLLSYCQWWARPEAKWDTSSSAAAERGTRFHKAIADYAVTRAVRTVDNDIAAEYTHAALWLDGLVGLGSQDVFAEIAMAWDPALDTADVLDVVDRAYKPQSRLCGTADLVLVVMANGKPTAVMVWDWKTGSGESAGPQLRALGLMAARAFGVEHATVAALEVRDSGVTEVAREELDAFSLAGIAGELAEMIAAIETAEPTPGSHCGELYCPARLHCPLGATAMAQVVDVIPAESLVRRDAYRITDPIRTAEQAIWTVDVLRLMGAWLDAKKDEIKKLVPDDGWRAEDGRVLKETTATIEAFDKHKALALIKQLGATDEQIGSLYYSFDKSNGLRVSGGKTKPRVTRAKKRSAA